MRFFFGFLHFMSKRKTNKMKPLELNLVAGVSTFLLLLS